MRIHAWVVGLLLGLPAMGAAAVTDGTHELQVEDTWVPGAVLVMPPDPLEAGRYIVGFHELPDQRSHYQGDPVVKVDESLRYFVVETRKPALLQAGALVDHRVRYVEADHNDWHLALVPNDAQYGHSGHYGTKVTKTESAWDVTTGSTAVTIAVVDTGINRNHEDFTGGRVLQGFDYYNGDNDPDDTGGSCSYHGSHTAGTAAATINNGKGIAGMSQSNILPHKIFHRTGGGPFGCSAATTSNIADALRDAGDAGAAVSSNSWGGGGASTTLNDAISYANSKGTVHVAAAGNSGSCTDCVGEPWRSNPGITIVVSCTDADDNWCSFSSQGPQVDVAAPGSGILSVDGGSNTGYSTKSGTSMSTPHVSGAVALYEEVNPGQSFSTVEDAVKVAADDVGLSSDRQGSGRLDTCELVGGQNCGAVAQPACDDGVDNDGDGLIDYPNDPGCSSAADTDETDPAPGGNNMHVHSIGHRRQGPPNHNADLLIDIVINDANEAGVSTATVSVEVSKTGGPTASGSGDTDGSGAITFRWTDSGVGEFTTCVTDLSKVDWTWDAAADHASSGSCHTGSI